MAVPNSRRRAALRCRVPEACGSLDGQRVSLGIRPEHIVLAAHETPGAFSLRVSVMEPTGADTMIVARQGSDELAAMIKGRHSFRQDDPICFEPLPNSLHVFTPDGAAVRVESLV